MSNDNAIVRAFKLWAKISMMIVDGKRDAATVADVLQTILEPSLRPTEFDPAAFIGTGWKWADKDADARSLTLPNVDFSKVLFETCLEEGEARIIGEEKRRRLSAKGGIRLDPRFGVTLYQEEGQKTLERLYEERGITYLDFFGRILVSPDGYRYVLYLYRSDDGRWGWDAHWLGSDWLDRFFSARLAS